MTIQEQPLFKISIWVLKIAVYVLIAIPLLLYPLLYFMQERLLFMPPKMDNDVLDWIKVNSPQTEEVRITTPDNVILHGWLVKNSQEEKSPLLIYFGGNGDEVSGLVTIADRFMGWSLLLMNYRGYGLSGGSPTETHLFNDALHVYDHFSHNPAIDNHRVVAMGRSLGTGVAVYLASQRPLKGLILISPYDSVRNIAQNIYPYVPVSWLLKHPFDAKSLAPSIKAPMLALIAEADTIIPPARAFALLEAWDGTTYHQVIKNVGHNNITNDPSCWEHITTFLHLMRTV